MWRLLVVGLVCFSARAWASDAALDAYFDASLKRHPFVATELGVHVYDREVPALDDASIVKWNAALRIHRAAIAVLPAGCDDACKLDHTMVVQSIDAELFEYEQLRSLDRWPDAWVSHATAATFPLIKRTFAPLAVRADLVQARLDKLPALYAQARAHLLGTHAMVSPIAVDIAREDLAGAVEFIGSDVPKAFVSLSPERQARLKTSIDRVLAALHTFDTMLDKEVRPRAHAPIAIGPELLARKLLLDESIDEPLDPLLARGEAELRRLQVAFAEAAHAIDPKAEPLAVKARLGKDHPAASAVLGEVRGRLAGLRKFLVDRHIVTVPSEILPIVDETPPFMRAMTQASIDSPGSFETVAHEAYYHVTLPDPSWPAARSEDYLSGALSRPLIDVVSIHEAFPGHYLQFLWVPKLASRARRMTSVSSNVEGWAHYTEQMMIDEGWGKEQPMIRLAQLSDALLRAARYVVAIRMHAKKMTVAEAQRFFVTDGYQSNEVALVEAKRGTEDPTYLYYTWGKLQLLSMRKELEQKWGATYSLQRFHDAVMAEGPIPLPLMRKALLAR